jgi:hypothetical protein
VTPPSTAALVARLRRCFELAGSPTAHHVGDGYVIDAAQYHLLVEVDHSLRLVLDAAEATLAAASSEVGAIRARVERERAEYPPNPRALRVAYELGRDDRATLLAEVDRLTAALAAAERDRLVMARALHWHTTSGAEMPEADRLDAIDAANRLLGHEDRNDG